jgi:hypothetical protein
MLHLPAARTALCPPGSESFQPTNLSVPRTPQAAAFDRSSPIRKTHWQGKTMALLPRSSIECLRKAEGTVSYNRVGAHFAYRRGEDLGYCYHVGQEHIATDTKAREISYWIGIAEARAIAGMVVECRVSLSNPSRRGSRMGSANL